MRRFRSGSGWQAVGLRRPEIIWTETMGRTRSDHGAGRGGLAIDRGERGERAPGGSRERGHAGVDGGQAGRTGRDAGTGGHRRRRARSDGDQHWRAVDILAMIIAAFRVILPPMIAILAAATAAYGLFMLAFG